LVPSAQQNLLWLAAIAWCCAFLLLFARLAHTGWRWQQRQAPNG
jgi:hypothetical protein